MALAPHVGAQVLTPATDSRAPAATPPAAATATPVATYSPVAAATPYPTATAALPPTAEANLPPPPAGYRYVRLTSTHAPAPLAAPELQYEDGDPIAPGYRVLEQPRRGLVTAGYVVTAIPYGISAMAALSADFKNQSWYLLLPFVGPWMTIGRRNYADCTKSENARETGTCAIDVLVVIGLAMDGVMQVAGGTLLLTGYLATTKRLVRNDVSLSLQPQVIGTGYGVGASGTF